MPPRVSMNTLSQEQQLIQALSRLPFLSAAVLFGSRARGTGNPQSDIDIAVLPDSPLSAQQRYETIQALSQVAGSPIDLVDLAVEHGVVAREALTRGRVLFVKDARRFQDRLRMLVYDAEDFLPALRAGQQEALRRWIKTSPATS